MLKDIPGYEGLYAITEDGQVWSYPKLGSTKAGKWLKAGKHYKGYSQHFLTKEGQRKTIFTHKLVATTYIPNPVGFGEINHKNCNKTDNRVCNLEWCDRRTNMRHAKLEGRLVVRRFEKHSMAILDRQKVVEIRNKYASKLRNQYELARDYGVTQSAIWCIVHRKVWDF